MMNLAVVFLFFILVCGVAFWTRESHGSKISLLLMGRRMTLPLFVFSLVASWYGGVTGVTALAYEHGIYAFVTQGLVWYGSYLIFALLIVGRIQGTGAATFPDVVRIHLGPRAGNVARLLNLLSLMPIAYVLGLGILIQFFFGLPLIPSAAIGLMVVFLYSLFGGLRSLVFAEVVQCVLMIAAVFSVFIASWIKMGSPLIWFQQLPDSFFDPTGGFPISEILVWGFISMATLVDPLFYQRSMALSDPKLARKGILWATLIWFCFDLCTVGGALYARVALTDWSPNESYLQHAMNILPVGLQGLFMAGMFAVVLSTLDAGIFSTASILLGDEVDLKRQRRFQIAVGLVSLLFVPFFDGSIAKVWKFLGSFSSSCLLLPWILMLILPKFRSENRFLLSVGSGVAAIAFQWIWSLNHSAWDMAILNEPFYWGAMGSIAGMGIGILPRILIELRRRLT